jgi:hypothetical protein
MVVVMMGVEPTTSDLRGLKFEVMVNHGLRQKDS